MTSEDDLPDTQPVSFRGRLSGDDDDYPLGEFPPLTAADLEGSMLGKALASALDSNVCVAPALDVNFVEPWVLPGDA
jgi:hypothetical protein